MLHNFTAESLSYYFFPYKPQPEILRENTWNEDKRELVQRFQRKYSNVGSLVGSVLPIFLSVLFSLMWNKC